MNRASAAYTGLRRLQLAAWIAAALGFALLALGAVFDPRTALHSYLFAWVFVWGLSSGALGMLFVHALTGGGWGQALQRALQAAAQLFPLLALLLLPVLLNLGSIYDWMGSAHEGQLLEKKAWYLNSGFFLGRTIGYLVLWSVLAWTMDVGLRRCLRGEAHADAFLHRLGAVGLILLVLTVTLAAIDWVMSLQARFYSTIFGMIVIAAQFLGALAVATLAATLRGRRPELAHYVSAQRRRDLGNLMLAAVVMWAYLAFMQYLVVWSGNLPDEIVWYLPRMKTSWFWLGVAIVAVGFVIPLFALLMRDLKESRSGLLGIAAMLLLGQLFYAFWLVEPAFRKGGFAVLWTDLAALLALGGLWGAAFLWRLLLLPAAPAEPQPRSGVEVKHHA